MDFQLVVIPVQPNQVTEEQTLNNVIMLRQFVVSVKPLFEALKGANSALLSKIQEVIDLGHAYLTISDALQLCSPRNISAVQTIIDEVINEDVNYSKSPLDLLNQRTFAVKVGNDFWHERDHAWLTSRSPA